MSHAYTLHDLQHIIAPIAASYGVSRVYLFGSYARGETTAHSDIDLRIDKGNIKGLIRLAGFKLAVEDALQRPVDLLTTDSLDVRFLDQIKQEEVLLYAAPQ